MPVKFVNFLKSRLIFYVFYLYIVSKCLHSHNKRKDSLKGSLDRVFFAVEVEFPKISAPWSTDTF